MGNHNSGRRPHLDPPVEWKVTIPTSVAQRVEIALVDPARGKPRFGARAQLITQLLREWLARQAVEVKP